MAAIGRAVGKLESPIDRVIRGVLGIGCAVRKHAMERGHRFAHTLGGHASHANHEGSALLVVDRQPLEVLLAAVEEAARRSQFGGSM